MATSNLLHSFHETRTFKQKKNAYGKIRKYREREGDKKGYDKILNYQTELRIQVILLCNAVVLYKFRIRFHFSVLTLKLETKPTGLSFWKISSNNHKKKKQIYREQSWDDGVEN